MPRQAYRRSARSSIPPDFDQFWNAFDYKVGRQPALRALDEDCVCSATAPGTAVRREVVSRGVRDS